MEKRSLGQSGIYVSPIAFGGNVFGWTVDKNEAFELLDSFVEGGFDFIDTADSYSWWVDGNDGVESETMIGKWIEARKNRHKIVLSTKVGSQTRKNPKNISKKFILENVESSLRRLKTDYIDLYQTHFDDEITPVEETLSAYQQLMKEGKVRAIGTSNMSSERILQSLQASEREGLPKYETLQPLYNLMERETYEKELEPIVTKNNMGVLNYYSLASGFLTGKYRSEIDLRKSPRGGGVEKYLTAKGFEVLDSLDAVSQKHGTTPATISLAWLLARPTITAPIVSATNLEQLKSIMDAPGIKLDEIDMERLDAASDWR